MSNAALLSKTRPWRHQEDAFHFAFPKRAAMLALDMGTGKSKVVVDLIASREHRRTLILCPLSVVRAWVRQFEVHSAVPVEVLALDEGSVAARTEKAKAAWDNGRLAVVMNYEAARLEPFASWARAQLWDLVVCDESHRIKAVAGAASRFVRALTRSSRYRLCLTGTPMAHSPLDVWAQFCFLAPGVFGRFRDFRDRYAVMGGYLEKQVIAYRNLDELHRRFYGHAFRVRASEVLDLPPAVHVQRSCSLSPGSLRLYTALETDFYAAVERGEITVSNALVKLLRLQQITSGFTVTDDGEEVELDRGKAEALEDTLEDLPFDEPIVVFARFRRDLAAIRAEAEKQGRKVAELSGSSKGLGAWQAGLADVLAVQIGAGAEGIDLTRARFCIFYSLGFSLAQYLQALARLHRPGQTRSVTYIHLLASGTVDWKVMKALEKREEVVESVLSSRMAREGLVVT